MILDFKVYINELSTDSKQEELIQQTVLHP
jgi:hypothetical protein